jgi:hypothetical protein
MPVVTTSDQWARDVVESCLAQRATGATPAEVRDRAKRELVSLGPTIKVDFRDLINVEGYSCPAAPVERARKVTITRGKGNGSCAILLETERK